MIVILCLLELLMQSFLTTGRKRVLLLVLKYLHVSYDQSTGASAMSEASRLIPDMLPFRYDTLVDLRHHPEMPRINIHVFYNV